MLEQFTYDEYRTLLGRVGDGRTNVCFSDFHRQVAAERYFILRHDVDFCPAMALEMARIEAGMGVRATYFFFLTGRYYSLLTERFISVPRQIAELGHDIGLHYDVQIVEIVGGDDPLAFLDRQAGLLEALTGMPVKSIAMHNPSSNGSDLFNGIERFINVYDDAFMRDIAYFSDSCGAWRDRTYEVLTGDNENIPPRLQLLIHPVHWGPKAQDRWTRLAAWVADRERFLRESERLVEGIWRSHPGVAEHDRRLARARREG